MKPLSDGELFPNNAVVEPLTTIRRTPATPAETDVFDWASDDSVVVKPQPGVAVYENKYRDTVIRTENIDDPDEGDHFAYLTPASVRPVINALSAHAPKRKP